MCVLAVRKQGRPSNWRVVSVHIVFEKRISMQKGACTVLCAMALGNIALTQWPSLVAAIDKVITNPCLVWFYIELTSILWISNHNLLETWSYMYNNGSFTHLKAVASDFHWLFCTGGPCTLAKLLYNTAWRSNTIVCECWHESGEHRPADLECLFLHETCTYMYMKTWTRPSDSQSNTTQCNSPKTVIFKEKWAASGGTRTRNILHSRQTLYQLSSELHVHVTCH